MRPSLRLNQYRQLLSQRRTGRSSPHAGCQIMSAPGRRNRSAPEIFIMPVLAFLNLQYDPAGGQSRRAP